MKAGDVLFFAETANPRHTPLGRGRVERRSILFKYASRGVARATGQFFTPEARFGEWTKTLSPEQHAVLYGPGVHTGR